MCAVPELLRDDGLVTVFHDDPILSRTLDLLLAFHRLAFLFSVDQLSEIDLVFKYHSDRRNVPVEFLAPVVTFVIIRVVEIEIRYRCQHLFLAEYLCSLIIADSLRRHSEYPSDRFCGRLVDDEMVAVIRVEFVAEGRAGADILPSLCLGLLCALCLDGCLSCEVVVEDVPHWEHHIVVVLD